MGFQDIAKAGVGSSGDAQKLMRDFGVACAGMVDLSEEANLRLCGPGSVRLPEKWSLSRAPWMPCGSILLCDVPSVLSPNRQGFSRL